MGRVETVSYDDMVIAEYGWLGDKVVKKTMTDADIKLDVTIDTLGRVTGETFSNISDSTSLITNSYDYTSYSNRLDTRNTVDYSFDTLGKLSAEDAVSYTSDILGNPTNATDDGFTYTTDDEDRVTKVEDDTVTLGEYEYDKLGRRSSKTVGDTTTNFVYDISGNIIAEYEDETWVRDYIYGANGEAIYMKLPQTTTTNNEFDNFVEFVEAWLCEPNCTTTDLTWDIDDSNNVDLADFALSALYFDDGFTINGRYLLTDLRNSVIGFVGLDNSVTEISYNAWGAPSYSGDLEGLSILWNGYYYDDETDNYYLRNRYYSPLERKFITEDPHGTNPDGTWNNGFSILDQYIDGFGLGVYAGFDPINAIDPWGLKNGESYCEYGTGNVVVNIFNTKSTKICTKEHENKHKKQLKKTCQLVNECIVNKKASRAECIKAYREWFDANEDEDECEAYKQSIACAKWNMFWKGCNKKKCKSGCCKDFADYRKKMESNKKYHCGKAGKRKPSPFGKGGVIK